MTHDDTLTASSMPLLYAQDFVLTAGEADVCGRMPATLVAQRFIEVASQHANTLNIGFDRLSKLGVAWVLSRLSFRFKQLPGINCHYRIETWVESWGRFSSERCFAVRDLDADTIIGYGRTVWAAIDIHKRRAADLSELNTSQYIYEGCLCPIPRQGAHQPIAQPEGVHSYTFRVMDMDSNGHVNTVRYIEHILNIWPLEFYLAHSLTGFEIAFRKECFSGQNVHILSSSDKDALTYIDVARSEDRERVVSAIAHWT